MTNPGNFRIEIAAAKSGGMSDPRNGTMLKMFNMVDIGERAGSGIPNILRVWRENGWSEPTITQTFNPDRITLTLALSPTSDDKPAIKNADKKALIKSADKKMSIKTVERKELIIQYLTDHASATSSELCELLDLKPTRVRTIMRGLIAEDIVVAEGGNRNRTYRLKA